MNNNKHAVTKNGELINIDKRLTKELNLILEEIEDVSFKIKSPESAIDRIRDIVMKEMMGQNYVVIGVAPVPGKTTIFLRSWLSSKIGEDSIRQALKGFEAHWPTYRTKMLNGFLQVEAAAKERLKRKGDKS